jgi:hypothetical protein
MIAWRCGRIINIASGGGATMLPYFSAYVTSKTAALIEDVTEPRQPGPALERPAALLVALAFGKADVLSGRYMYPRTISTADRGSPGNRGQEALFPADPAALSTFGPERRPFRSGKLRSIRGAKCA